MGFQLCGAGYTAWDKGKSDEMRSQLGMRKFDKQIRERKKNRLEHLQGMPSENTRPIRRRDPGRLGSIWFHVWRRNGLKS
jgi:hypothetical protein